MIAKTRPHLGQFDLHLRRISARFNQECHSPTKSSMGRRKRACCSVGLRPAYVALRFLLSTRLLSMKDEATDRLMRDPILICNCTKWFVVLHHTMKKHRPVFS